MTHAIRAEFRKFFTTRLWWGMGIATFVAGAGFSLLLAVIFTLGSVQSQPGMPNGIALTRIVFTGGISVGYLLTLAVGVMTIGAEYRHKTITSTFLSNPRRTVVMSAKVVSLLVIGAFYGLISLLGSVVVGASVLVLRGEHPFADSGIWRTLALALLALGLWALIGLGVGILVPNQVAALLIAIGVAWIVEPIAGVLLGLFATGKEIVPYLPTQATQAMLNTSSAFGAPSTDPTTTMTWWVAAVVLAAYAVVMAGVGSALTVRRDIS